MTNRQIFLQHVGQTSSAPLCLDIVRAAGSRMWDADEKEYLDLIAGISVCNLGHCHPRVVRAVQEQAEKYMHLMVYGELIQSPQVLYAQKLTRHLPASLDSVFFTASGSEATEGAMKLAKRHTGRTKIISYKNSYHGSTQGALSAMGSEYWKQAFRPLLPQVMQFEFNHFGQLDEIDEDTACVIAETVQAEAGVIKPLNGWLEALAARCREKGALLVLDEIQCGFGRTGTLWGFQQYGVVPDILLLGKALGGGMPLGAFIASGSLMGKLTYDPVLGHINTFGGHPVCCAAGLASFEALLEEDILSTVIKKSELFESLLDHNAIKKINRSGLLIAVHFESFDSNKQIIDRLIAEGLFTDWFLFASHALRIAPPLNISEADIQYACSIIRQVLDTLKRDD